jgi:hypothetical protein
MKLKLNVTFLILGLFIFKVGVFDSFRRLAHHSNENVRMPSAEKSKLVGIR